jgi:hypothetical protein
MLLKDSTKFFIVQTGWKLMSVYLVCTGLFNCEHRPVTAVMNVANESSGPIKCEGAAVVSFGKELGGWLVE